MKTEILQQYVVQITKMMEVLKDEISDKNIEIAYYRLMAARQRLEMYLSK